MPVGICFIWTAEFVLFYTDTPIRIVTALKVVGREALTIFCPPGPLPLRYDSSISESGGGFGRGGIDFWKVHAVEDMYRSG